MSGCASEPQLQRIRTGPCSGVRSATAVTPSGGCGSCSRMYCDARGSNQRAALSVPVSMICDTRWSDIGCATGTSWESRSEEHTSELQSHLNLVCRLLLEKKKKDN